MISHNLTGQHFGYSAVDLTQLGNMRYTLVTIAIDESPSTESFKKEMEQCVKNAIEGCKKTYSDYLLLRVVAFSNSLREIHGFKLLQDCNPSDYDNCLRGGSGTLLFESVLNVINASLQYGKTLSEQDMDVNAITIVITDGEDNRSVRVGPSDIKNAIRDAKKQESLESILTILVGVGVGTYTDVGQYLTNFKDEAEISQYVELKDADDKTLGRLSGFISKSVSSQSQALGSGAMSQPLQF